MASNQYQYRSHIFSLSEVELAMHENLITCVIFGNEGNVQVNGKRAQLIGRIICIKPDVMHGVLIPEGGAEVLYLDGVKLPEDMAEFTVLDNRWADVPASFHRSDRQRIGALRKALGGRDICNEQIVLSIIERLYVNPLDRMTQEELAEYMGLDRTQALKTFKRITGQTFRRYKKWAATVSVTSSVCNNGIFIGHAGLDAGFSDAAHTARTAKEVFGLTPTDGANSLIGISTLLA